MLRTKAHHQLDMCHGSLADKILLFALPLMASSMLQLLFNAADVIVVGQFAGQESLAAVGSTTSLINLLIALFVGLSVGANVVVARNLGGQRPKIVSRAVHTAIFLALVSGVFLGVFGFIMAHQLLVWMSSPADVIDLSTIYLRIYFLGMPATLAYNFGAAILRAQGDTKRPLYYLIVAGIVNVILNLFTVLVLHMDVAGVASATTISQYISAGLILRCLSKEEGPLRPDRPARRISGHRVLPVQRADPVLHQLLRLHRDGRVRRRQQHRKLCLSGHERLLPDQPDLHRAELRRRGLQAGGQEPVLLPGLCDPHRADPGQPGLLLRPPPGEHLQLRRGGHPAGHHPPGLHRPDLRPVRHHGHHGGQPARPGLLCGLRIVWIFTIFQMDRTPENLYISYPISWIVTGSVHILYFLYVRRKAFALVKTDSHVAAEGRHPASKA